MASGTISNSNGKIALASGTYFSLGCTLSSTQYPTGIVLPLEAANGTKPYWKNRDVYGGADTYTLYLSNSNGSIKYTLGTVTLNNDGSDVTQKSFSASCPNLHGQALYLSGNSEKLELRFGTNNTSMSVTINTATYATAVVAGDPIKATDRSQIGVATTQYATISDSHFSSGTKAEASTFNSQVLGI